TIPGPPRQGPTRRWGRWPPRAPGPPGWFEWPAGSAARRRRPGPSWKDRRGRLTVQGQSKADRCSASRGLLDPDRAAVRGHHSAGDGQAQSGPATAAVDVAPVELLEHAIAFGRRDPRAPVGP